VAGPAPAVVFEAVWKKFQRGERHDCLRDLIPALVRRAWRPSDPLTAQEFWAIRDMSFAVDPGEALGIVGSNGAGKSTILKLLTKILRPTRGRCRVTGRIGALIEVASSFSGDLTGRENVFLQGAIMGMTRQETARRFDEIVEFAEVGPFIDTPVKRYSNGMNARLGFSIAAHLDPDVLIIDEVLSVGDLAFQERCLRRMLEFKRRGAAIVFVSHNVSAIAALCDQVMIVASGRKHFSGSTAQALERYLHTSHGEGDSETGGGAFEQVSVRDVTGRPVSVCQPGAALTVDARVRFHQEVREVCFGIAVHQTSSNVCAYNVESHTLGVAPAVCRPDQLVDVTFALEANLTRGHYLVELYAKTADTELVVARSHPAAFLRIDESSTISGVADLGARCDVGQVPAGIEEGRGLFDTALVAPGTSREP
jgi:lipopolysaccharide transport system ATP-binding protein